MSQYHYEYCWSEKAQLDIKKKIATLLINENLILVTGAGFSNNFNYPLWEKFLDDLKTFCHVKIDKNTLKFNGILNCLKYAQAIYDEADKNNFVNFVSESFDPCKCKKPIDDFYQTLILLGFCGFATLNYDHTLEIIIDNYVPGNRTEPINFCGSDREILIRNFLNNATKKENNFRYVLHLHGVYNAPSSIILTQSSYEKWYLNGSVTVLIRLVDTLEKELKNNPPLFGKVSEMKRRIQMMYSDNTLQSLHKKVIWTLFARYHLFFMGFSTDDTFFMNLLNVVINDFMLPKPPEHFVLASYDSIESEADEQKNEEINRKKEEICDKMLNRGIMPIFYPAKNHNYEQGLQEFILEIESLKTQVQSDKKEQSPLKKRKTSLHHDKTIDDITSFTMGLK